MKQTCRVLLVLAALWGCAPVGGHEGMARRGHDVYAVGAKGVLGVGEQHGQPLSTGWTSTGPDSTDYNEETHIRGSPYTAEQLFAGCWCLMLASAPLLLAALAEKDRPGPVVAPAHPPAPIHPIPSTPPTPPTPRTVPILITTHSTHPIHPTHPPT